MKFMVAFSSPKRSAQVVEVACQHAVAMGAELILLRVVPDAEKVGVVAQLIATERPIEKALEQVNMVAEELKKRGINVVGQVHVGEVAPGIIKMAEELKADLLFVGTTSFHAKPAFLMTKDPIVHYLVDHCPISLCLVRYDQNAEQTEQENNVGD